MNWKNLNLVIRRPDGTMANVGISQLWDKRFFDQVDVAEGADEDMTHLVALLEEMRLFNEGKRCAFGTSHIFKRECVIEDRTIVEKLVPRLVYDKDKPAQFIDEVRDWWGEEEMNEYLSPLTGRNEKGYKLMLLPDSDDLDVD